MRIANYTNLSPLGAIVRKYFSGSGISSIYDKYISGIYNTIHNTFMEMIFKMNLPVTNKLLDTYRQAALDIDKRSIDDVVMRGIEPEGLDEGVRRRGPAERYNAEQMCFIAQALGIKLPEGIYNASYAKIRSKIHEMVNAISTDHEMANRWITEKIEFWYDNPNTPIITLPSRGEAFGMYFKLKAFLEYKAIQNLASRESISYEDAAKIFDTKTILVGHSNLRIKDAFRAKFDSIFGAVFENLYKVSFEEFMTSRPDNFIKDLKLVPPKP